MPNVTKIEQKEAIDASASIAFRRGANGVAVMADRQRTEPPDGTEEHAHHTDHSIHELASTIALVSNVPKKKRVRRSVRIMHTRQHRRIANRQREFAGPYWKKLMVATAPLISAMTHSYGKKNERKGLAVRMTRERR